MGRRGTRKTPSPYVMRSAARAFEFRARGMTFREIASEMECSVSTVYEAVTEGAKLLLREHEADTEIASMLARNDAGVVSIWDAYRRGDYKAHEAMDRLEKRRALLLGLNAPVKIAVKGEVTVTIEDTAERARGLLAEIEAFRQGVNDASLNGHARSG
jgi:hypothetical protein